MASSLLPLLSQLRMSLLVRSMPSADLSDGRLASSEGFIYSDGVGLVVRDSNDAEEMIGARNNLGGFSDNLIALVVGPKGLVDLGSVATHEGLCLRRNVS